MPLLNRLSLTRPYVCQQCVHRQHLPRAASRTKMSNALKSAAATDRNAQWAEQAARVQSGAQQSMLSILEERGFVKDIAGPRESLDFLLTKKRIGVYVGVDPTAPSLHVGHLLPLMALYWMHLHGYRAVTLMGGGTAQIGDPSGRTDARSQQSTQVRQMNKRGMQEQLLGLWVQVKCLGIKHGFPQDTIQQKVYLDNITWLNNLKAVDLMRDLGSGMRVGSMLARDSVKVRMENGSGMSMSEFSYPLFQAYDWWHLYGKYGVQLQLGGSDQYGNLCAGMDTISYMRKTMLSEEHDVHDPLEAPFGIATPLLTTASGEKFGKSAGNAVWLDKDMLNSFDLYQYFLRTADDDVARYLKLFTFLPLDHIETVMAHHAQNESKRVPQHLLAKEVVSLAHGAAHASKAEAAHKEAFSYGTNMFHIGALRRVLEKSSSNEGKVEKNRKINEDLKQFLRYKREVAAASTKQPNAAAATAEVDASNVVTLPLTLLTDGAFPAVLLAAGLANSKSEARRMIQNNGVYVVLPNSGSAEEPHGLKWAPIPHGEGEVPNPRHYLLDFEALVLRSGKSKIQICRIITEEQFRAEGLTFPGWNALAQSAEPTRKE